MTRVPSRAAARAPATGPISTPSPATPPAATTLVRLPAGPAVVWQSRTDADGRAAPARRGAARRQRPHVRRGKAARGRGRELAHGLRRLQRRGALGAQDPRRAPRHRVPRCEQLGGQRQPVRGRRERVPPPRRRHGRDAASPTTCRRRPTAPRGAGATWPWSATCCTARAPAEGRTADWFRAGPRHRPAALEARRQGDRPPLDRHRRRASVLRRPRRVRGATHEARRRSRSSRCIG